MEKVGNFSNYYGYRLGKEKNILDPRLHTFKKEWFHGKKWWDIGCNSGELTISISQKYQPAYVLGTDLDASLVALARKALQSYLHVSPCKNLPLSFQLQLEDIHSKRPMGVEASGLHFPHNMVFQMANVVTTIPQRGYDIITCFSVTKWIHLYHGDAALQQVFTRIFTALLPGGKFLFEPQPWKSYHKRRYTNSITAHHYNNIQMRPKDFITYLITKVGFASSELLQVCSTSTGSFKRPLYVLTKGTDQAVAARACAAAGDSEACGDGGVGGGMQNSTCMTTNRSNKLKRTFDALS